MAQLDAYRRYSEASRSQGNQISSPNSKTPRAQTSPTFQQLLQGEASLWSPGSSPKLRKNVDHEEEHSPHNRKSVLAKVKERARKLRHSLSGKKHHHEQNLYGGNTTPSWGVRLEDYEDDEEDPEYLGAPMYESELAPANYKETARQHPREIHGVPSEKHVVASSVNKGVAKHDQKEEHLSPNKTMAETMSEKLGPACAAVSESVSEKLAPAYAAVSDATHNVANKIASLTVSTPEGTETGVGKAGSNRSSPQIWDKGVSVKEYLMQKLEPGEDERALSQVISEAISPRKTTGDHLGMVEKMKGAVSSFIWTEEPSQASTHSTKSLTVIPNASNADSSPHTSLSPTNASTTKLSSSSRMSLSPTNVSTTKTSSSSGTSRSHTNASTTKENSSSRTSLSPTNASTTKTSSSSHTSLTPPNASTTKTSSSSGSSLPRTNASTTKADSTSRTSLSLNYASTNKADSSSHTSLSPTNASTTKADSSSRTSASTTKTSSLPHITTASTTTSPRSAISKRSLSVHAPVSTTTASTTKTSSSTHAPYSTTYEKSSTQIPVSTYITEVIEEENHGRVLQAN